MNNLDSPLLNRPMTPLQASFSKPAIVDGYSIVRKLGEGTMANVYLATHKETFATVAIKQLKPESSRKSSHIEMLRSESEMRQRMDHLNVAKVLSANLDDKQPYLVMEYVDGVSLDHHDDPDNLLPLRTVLNVLRQAANALQHAAEHGIVHRDVKPGNIILASNGRVKLTDFGCAMKSGEKQDAVAGSLMYMSPEQISGEPVDLRSDMYSLAVVAYRLLTGKRLFDVDSTFDLHTAVLHFQPKSLQSLRPELPSSLSKLVSHSLSKYAGQRPADWNEFIRELDAVYHQIAMNPALVDIDDLRGLSAQTMSQYRAQAPVLSQQEQFREFERSRRYSTSTFSHSVMRY